MPPQMRLCASSLPRSKRLLYGCANTTALLTVYHVAMNTCESLPSTFASMREAPLPMQVMLLEYGGCGGVGTSGVQPASGSVAGLLSRSALAMAVSVRQRRYTALLECEVSML